MVTAALMPRNLRPRFIFMPKDTLFFSPLVDFKSTAHPVIGVLEDVDSEVCRKIRKPHVPGITLQLQEFKKPAVPQGQQKQALQDRERG